ncbi:hypothetical protein [Defluviimonas sp. WL0075]|uniref:Uncharacterized protein n=1 Tax=Albidovulum sediminicola TaxID=2984331 RepID=A0ABT2YXX6_9RHOB|nr:hypothetical protein [Defluviimonas sp. WL0075]MCV2863617.1 hypothetical protein [Defluviimonas sp. WL0075]
MKGLVSRLGQVLGIVPADTASSDPFGTAQVWAAEAQDQNVWAALFDDRDFWGLEDEDERDNAPLTPFAACQSMTWYDDDFVECGWSAHHGPAREIFVGNSFVDQWGAEFDRRAVARGVTANAFVMVFSQGGTLPGWFTSPRDAEVGGVRLVYLGVLTVQ